MLNAEQRKARAQRALSIRWSAHRAAAVAKVPPTAKERVAKKKAWGKRMEWPEGYFDLAHSLPRLSSIASFTEPIHGRGNRQVPIATGESA